MQNELSCVLLIPFEVSSPPPSRLKIKLFSKLDEKKALAACAK
jgi:hypothetical protein